MRERSGFRFRLSWLVLLAMPVAFVAACSGGGGNGGSRSTIEGDLDLDIRQKAHVVLAVRESGLAASITLGDGMGVAPTGVVLEGKGEVYEFPEAGLTLYAARIAGPPVEDGPCGASPVSLSFTLERRGESARVGGGIAAYCAQASWAGAPVRLLRLSGDLPLPFPAARPAASNGARP